MEALKYWNAETNKGKWCIPKKGTVDYNEVMRLKAQMEKQAKIKKAK